MDIDPLDRKNGAFRNSDSTCAVSCAQLRSAALHQVSEAQLPSQPTAPVKDVSSDRLIMPPVQKGRKGEEEGTNTASRTVVGFS